MYNLNVNLATSAANAVNNLLMVESGCNTPRTPEILNSLIAMTNPMDNYNFGQNNSTTAKLSSSNQTNLTSALNRPPTNMMSSSDSNSSSSSQLESSPTCNNLPSVQQTCSELIKAGLKLSIEQKRKHQNSDGEDLLDLDKCTRNKRARRIIECSESEEDKHKQDGMQNWAWYENDDYYAKLTPEDEERRRRRRERNKIAATKCRLKKREKTANLVSESETLETQNIELKKQLQELQNQQRTLSEILAMHRPHCQNNIRRHVVLQETTQTMYNNRLPPVNSVIENQHQQHHSFNSSPTSSSASNNNSNNNTNSVRPASVEPNYRHHHQQQQQSLIDYNRPASVGGCLSATNNNNNNLSYISRSNNNNMNNFTHQMKTPSIIIEDVTALANDSSSSSSSYQPQLTNLDNPNNAYHYNHHQCHNYSNQNYQTGIDNGCMA